MNNILKLLGLSILSILSIEKSVAMQNQPVENQAAQVRTMRLNEIRNFFKNNRRPITRTITPDELNFYNNVLNRIPMLNGYFQVRNVRNNRRVRSFLTLNLDNVGMYEFGSVMHKLLNKTNNYARSRGANRREALQNDIYMHQFIRQVLSNTMIHH